MPSIFGDFIQSLEKELQKPLPGEEAQLLMAPQHRKTELERYKNDTDYRASSVLIPLYYKEGAIFTTFIKRTKDKGVHSEQISFPGGKRDPEDISSEETAIREAEEEIGGGLETIEIVIQPFDPSHDPAVRVQVPASPGHPMIIGGVPYVSGEIAQRCRRVVIERAAARDR